MIGRLLNSQGIYNLLSGLTGTLTTGISSANLGLVHVTGVTTRRAGVVTGLLLIAVAFLPRIATLIILVPPAVAGAILLYTAAYMMVSGAELIMSRMLNTRRRATVGFSLVAGFAVFIVPELTTGLPRELEPMLGSGLIVGVVVAITLNLLFRIGISRRCQVLLTEPRPGPQATRFLEECGADWGARREVITRASVGIGEALETLHAAGGIDGPYSATPVWLPRSSVGARPDAPASCFTESL